MNSDQDKQINMLMDQLDRYVFLMELSVLVYEQGGRAFTFRCKKNDDFMQAIENVMNYLNTVYTVKEFAGSFPRNDEVNSIQNTYYLNDLWYGFTLEYRNCAVHSFALPRSYNPEDGELVLIVDELINKQNELLNNERDRDKRNKINGRIAKLESFKHSFTNCFPISQFIIRSSEHVLEMTTKMLHAEFKNTTKDVLSKLIMLNQTKEDPTVSIIIENFYYNSKSKLKNGETLFQEIHRLYVEKGYISFSHYDSTGWF